MVPSGSTQTSDVYLSRDQLSGVQNLFLIDQGNKNFVLGTSKRRPNALTPTVSILLLLIGLVVAGVFAFAGVMAVALFLAALFIVLAILAFRKSTREKRLDESGNLLKATISTVSERERAPGVTTAMRVLGVIGFITDLFSDSSSSRSLASRGPGSYQPQDFYEICIAFSATTPSGSQISGTSKRNRPELRGSLPIEGDPLVLLYIDDGLYKLM